MQSATRSSEIVSDAWWLAGDGLAELTPPAASPDTEQWRLAAARLDARLGSGGAGRIVLVASADRGDGRTTAALELSRALVDRLGRRTLLVDADPRLALRRPSDEGRLGLAARLEATPQKALSELLRGAARPAEAMWRVGSGALYFSVEHGAPIMELVRGAATLRARYDYVVVDTPALAVSADAPILARGADGVVLVIRPGRTRRRALALALEALVDAPMVGCVVAAR